MPVQFNNRVVNELAWAICSDHLLWEFNHDSQLLPDQSWHRECIRLHLPWLSGLDNDPERLQVHMDKGSGHLLGKRFERLLEFWLRNSPHVELYEQNIQLIENGITCGEIDFIFRDWNHKLILMEAAIKYYLVAGELKMENCIGPNAKDSLSNKLRKVNRQQLNLDFKPLHNYIDNLGLEDIRPMLFLKGQLFYESARANGYYKVSELGRDFFEDRLWIFLPKEEWIGHYSGSIGKLPVYSGEIAFKRLKEIMAETKRSTLFAKIDLHENNIIEKVRYYSVTDSWPENQTNVKS